MKNVLIFCENLATLNVSGYSQKCVLFGYFKCEHIFMVFTDHTFKFFSLIQSYVRSSMAKNQSEIPFRYDEEVFFKAYDAIQRTWQKRESK